jgi:cytochrome c oxidase assembly protein subunit 15
MEASNRAIANWLILGAIMVYLMVMIGGITRLTGSGLSMVDWKPITGIFPPSDQASWQHAFDAYKEFPQYQKVNSDMTLSEFKSIFWWEFIHRQWGRVIGMVFGIGFIWFLVKGKLKGRLIGHVLILGAIGGFQGFLGWYMVKSGLISDPYVSHYRLTAHLITAVFTMSFALWLAFDLLFPIKGTQTGSKLATWLLVLLGVQLIYGGFMSGTKAGLFFPTWPDMNGQIVPDYVFSLEPFWKNFTENLVSIQFFHRLIAYVLTIGLIVLRFRARIETALQRFSLNAVTLIVLLQTTLGILTVVNSKGSIPIALAFIHQAVAVLLVAALVLVVHQYRKVTE